MKMKLFVGLILLLALNMSAFARGDGERLRFATGGTAGAYYPFGTAIAQIVGEDTGMQITVQSTGASRANIQLLDAGEVELAIVQNDVMDYAWRGVDLFEGERTQNFRTIAGVYSEVCQIIANPASGIRSIADLRGRSVSVGDAGSGVEFNARQILAAYGISFNDINMQNLSFAASADAMRDGRIDAFFAVSGIPTPAIIDLATTRDILVLNVDGANAVQLMRDYPFYTEQIIPAGTYRGMTTPATTVAVRATIIAHANVSENAIYNFTRSLFQNQPKLAEAHVRGADLSPSGAVQGISVPFHPGAERYLREIGALR